LTREDNPVTLLAISPAEDRIKEIGWIKCPDIHASGNLSASWIDIAKNIPLVS
jgi:hypothetical protein